MLEFYLCVIYKEKLVIKYSKAYIFSDYIIYIKKISAEKYICNITNLFLLETLSC